MSWVVFISKHCFCCFTLKYFRQETRDEILERDIGITLNFTEIVPGEPRPSGATGKLSDFEDFARLCDARLTKLPTHADATENTESDRIASLCRILGSKQPMTQLSQRISRCNRVWLDVKHKNWPGDWAAVQTTWPRPVLMLLHCTHFTQIIIFRLTASNWIQQMRLTQCGKYVCRHDGVH